MPSWFRRDTLCYVMVFLSSFVFRVALNQPTVTADGRLYMKIADNVVLNGCYSDSPPAGALCKPTWGNQPPGYPLFIAFVKVFFGATPRQIVVSQSFLYAVAVLYVLISVRLLFGTLNGWFLPTSLFLSISPLTLFWSQWILTETLAAAAVLWVAAESLRSLAARKLRTTIIAIALSAALMLRWDMIWLAFPVAIVAWHLYGLKQMLPKLAVIFGVIAIPVVLLIVRALALGLPLIPATLNASPEELPPGIVKFWKVTATKQTATTAVLWNVWNRQYANIESSFDYSSVSSDVNSAHLRSTLLALSALPNGSAVPHEIDQSFAEIAGEVERAKWYTRFVVLIERTVYMWTERDYVFNSGWFSDQEQYLRIYRIALLVVTFAAPFLFTRDTPEQIVSIAITLFVVSRTLFLVILNALEVRYVTPSIPLMELVFALLIMKLIQVGSKKREGLSSYVNDANRA